MDCEVDDKQILEDGHVISIADNGHNMCVKGKLYIILLMMWRIAHVRTLSVKVLHAVIYCVF